ncbi:MAG TPA: sortase [Candidatus Bathyarchaeia archaeon]|nr:sortase [Candidatus Bathyarchaeia archaeon]
MFTKFKKFFSKFKFDPRNAAFAVVVFLAVYAILFYFTSWNTKPVFETSLKADSSFAGSVGTDDKTLATKAGIMLGDYNVWAAKNDLNGNTAKLNGDPDGDKLPNYLEYVHGTDPKKTDSDGDGFNDRQEITNGYDPAAPGDARPTVQLSISKIGITAPMVWSKSESEKDQLADLQNGVAHFSKTASPGQNGNMIVSGHSSNFIWAKGKYNYIFKNLNSLEPDDVADIKMIQQNGKTITYHYKISEKFTTVANDARIFKNTDGPSLTLSTCWPLGSNLRRLIVKGEIVN